VIFFSQITLLGVVLDAKGTCTRKTIPKIEISGTRSDFPGLAIYHKTIFSRKVRRHPDYSITS